MSVMGVKGRKRASMAFLFNTSALLVVLVSLSFPFPADAFGRIPNFKLKSPSPPPNKPIYMPPTPTKKFPPSPPKKPIHYEPSKPPKKPVKPIMPKSSPPPYKQDHMPSTVFTTSKIGFSNPWKVIGKGAGEVTRKRVGEGIHRGHEAYDGLSPLLGGHGSPDSPPEALTLSPPRRVRRPSREEVLRKILNRLPRSPPRRVRRPSPKEVLQKILRRIRRSPPRRVRRPSPKEVLQKILKGRTRFSPPSWRRHPPKHA